MPPQPGPHDDRGNLGFFNTARDAECDEHADPLEEGHRTFVGSQESSEEAAGPKEGAAHDAEQEGQG
jgi:hypothetical protein